MQFNRRELITKSSVGLLALAVPSVGFAETFLSTKQDIALDAIIFEARRILNFHNNEENSSITRKYVQYMKDNNSNEYLTYIKSTLSTYVSTYYSNEFPDYRIECEIYNDNSPVEFYKNSVKLRVFFRIKNKSVLLQMAKGKDFESIDIIK